MTKSGTEESIRTWIKDKFNPGNEQHRLAVGRMVVAIWNCQTAEEQDSGFTSVHNGVGFNGVDDEFLSSIAEWFNAKGFLTGKQATSAAKRIAKYAVQLAAIKDQQPEMKAPERDTNPTDPETNQSELGFLEESSMK